jgi:molybdate transport system ATP-binding protein
MIEIRARHRIGDFTIAADIRAAGRVLALCGASGAGKTTLLNLIAGLALPAEGRIAIDETVFLDTAANIDMPARARRLGYVFQEPRLFPHLSVRANLRYGARFAPSGAPLVGFDDVVALLGVAPLLSRRPAKLSGGEKQRVAIGRALLMSPRALLLDEPLTAIDDARRHEILALIEQLRDAFAIPMIFVSHRADEVERLANDIALLSPGKPVELRAGLNSPR